MIANSFAWAGSIISLAWADWLGQVRSFGSLGQIDFLLLSMEVQEVHRRGFGTEKVLKTTF